MSVSCYVEIARRANAAVEVEHASTTSDMEKHIPHRLYSLVWSFFVTFSLQSFTHVARRRLVSTH